MIGVVTAAGDRDTVLEFFELFKTPWEFAVRGRSYRALLASDEAASRPFDAPIVIVYSAKPQDHDASLTARRIDGPATIQWGAASIPLTGQALSFAGASAVAATCSGRVVECASRRGDRTVRRVGYDLFAEVRQLLTEGQPVERAGSPTLELHIALLRSILVNAGVSFLEVPPRPYGYDFTCCLTHDLDFHGIRRHKFDRTLLGFFYRATVGTVIDLCRGRRSFEEAARNWRTAASLPLVFAGLLPDPWRPFDDYARSEKPEHSTFFVVPFKGRPGVGPAGAIDRARAVGYQASDITAEVRRAVKRGSEVAVHGIDAWRDSTSGDGELSAVRSVTGQTTAGVRMHWLYFDRESPARLEDAGFTYDSTWGYNDAVGYRAGTSQVFRLSGTRDLLELPLSIMDSALLFPNRMNLTSRHALKACRAIVGHARRFGGTVVVNWHDRSLAPERLWNQCYRELLSEIKRDSRAWFATAGQAVEWYRWRRSIRFIRQADGRGVSVTAGVLDPSLPCAVLKSYGATRDGSCFIGEERCDGTSGIAPTLYSWPTAQGIGA